MRFYVTTGDRLLPDWLAVETIERLSGETAAMVDLRVGGVEDFTVEVDGSVADVLEWLGVSSQRFPDLAVYYLDDLSKLREDVGRVVEYHRRDLREAMLLVKGKRERLMLESDFLAVLERVGESG